MIRLDASGFDAAFAEIEERAAIINTVAVREATEGLKNDWRDQVRRAGLGNRLANAVRAETYPKSGNSLSPAGVVYSNASKIMDAFDRGAQIVPVNGSEALAIPTKAVPNTRGSGGKLRKMTPVEVESHYDQDLILIRKGRNVLAFVEAVIGRRKGYKPATKRRMAQGRQKKLILMFTLVRSVKMPKTLNIDRSAQFWAARISQIVERAYR